MDSTSDTVPAFWVLAWALLDPCLDGGDGIVSV